MYNGKTLAITINYIRVGHWKLLQRCGCIWQTMWAGHGVTSHGTSGQIFRWTSSRRFLFLFFCAVWEYSWKTLGKTYEAEWWKSTVLDTSCSGTLQNGMFPFAITSGFRAAALEVCPLVVAWKKKRWGPCSSRCGVTGVVALLVDDARSVRDPKLTYLPIEEDYAQWVNPFLFWIWALKNDANIFKGEAFL